MNKRVISIILTTLFYFMNGQNDINHQYQVITFEESLVYDVKTMTEYRYSPFNQSAALFINDNKLLVFPNINNGNCLIISKDIYDDMYINNSFPVLPENDTPYFRYRNLMNQEQFNIENMKMLLAELGINYNKHTLYDEAERLAKKLTLESRKKLFIPMLYFLGEDLQELCPNANWNYSPVYHFQPYNEPRLYYKANSYSFLI